MQTRFNVQKVSARGTGLYLAYFGAGQFEWVVDDDQAVEYDDQEEAIADAKKHGGEVFAFGRPYLGHNEEARLERHFLQAAE